MRKLAFIALIGALALAACGKKEEEAPVTNNLVEPPVENVIVDEPEVAPLPEPTNDTAEAKPLAPPTVSEQQQIEDDAAATGMTARLSPDESSNGAD